MYLKQKKGVYLHTVFREVHLVIWRSMIVTQILTIETCKNIIVSGRKCSIFADLEYFINLFVATLLAANSGHKALNFVNNLF